MYIWQSSCWYTALMILGMTLIRANTLAFGLIGKDGPDRIIKICFGNMNLVFRSEVTLLEFWEYMFGILLTVQISYLESGKHLHWKKDFSSLFLNNGIFIPFFLSLMIQLRV